MQAVHDENKKCRLGVYMKSFAFFIILMYFGIGAVYAQDISVNVNGLSVTFIDQRPVNIEGWFSYRFVEFLKLLDLQ